MTKQKDPPKLKPGELVVGPITLKKHQVEPTKRLVEVMRNLRSHRGAVVVGATGCGKTYVMAAAIRILQDEGLLVGNPNKPFQLHPVFVLAPTNVLVKHRRIFNKCGLQGVEVLTGDSLRASYGDNFIKWTETLRGNKTEYDPYWDSDSMPDVILVDECQQFKNPNALRTKLLKAFIQQGGKVILISATPFQKASEAQIIAMATGLANTDREFDDYANLVSGGSPTDNSPTTTKRIKEDIEARDCWINISNVRYPFKPVIKNYLFDLTPAKAVIYRQAYEEYLIERRKHGKNDPSGVIARWVAMQKFRQKAELLRDDELSSLGFHIQTTENRAIIVASNFIPTLRSIWAKLTGVHGVAKSDIAFLIGSQTQKDKQLNIDKFQSGKARYFLTTLKSGGTGLDLHHEVEEALPRTILIPPTWSCYEMIQVLGRGQRITNLSAVHQFICWYRGTIEEEVSARLESKLSCVRELLERKDSFMLDIFNKESDREMAGKLDNLELDETTVSETEKDEEDSLLDLGLLDGDN